MLKPPSPIHQPKLLIGEGEEEVRFFHAFLSYLNLNEIQVEQYGGKNNLSAYLRTLVTPRAGFQNLTAIAITRDADQDADAAFQSVCAALRRADLSQPERHGEFTMHSPRVGVFIMPDGKSAGMLEDLCLAAQQADLAMSCVEGYFECLAQAQHPLPENMSKARLHAWLASRKLPDKRLGEAAESGYFDWENSAFDALKKFLIEI